ncbi:hypothetical protein [Methylobacterium sp. 285MFTsu5.1]|uniref:hypothetical protein n=1 Tax=Methylobacterium sp. 285MFTsu5.1 TaxID=1172187 RepID=UPI00035EF87E|nr:hypothetical protein [Methylobacterium sp. 285MFTsu5.1]
MTTQHPQQQQQQILQPAPDGRLLQLEARVEGVVAAISNVSAAVSTLSEKLDRGRQTPWAVIFSALGVMLTFTMAIGGLAYMPINNGISDLKAALIATQDRADKRVDAIANKMVSREEHELHWRAQERDYDFMRDRIGRVERRAESRLDRLEKSHFKAAD